jgi:hypothetical protein
VLLVVSTRVVIAIGVAIFYFSIGAGWLGVVTNQSVFSYNAFEVTGHVSPYLTTGLVPSNSTEDGQVWTILLPLFVSNVPILLAGAFFLAAAVFSVISFFRWKLMLLAGILGTLSGVLWVWGIGEIVQAAGSQIDKLCQLNCRAMSFSIFPQVGAYLAVFGGSVLILGFVLSKFEKLEYPLD